MSELTVQDKWMRRLLDKIYEYGKSRDVELWKSIYDDIAHLEFTLITQCDIYPQNEF